MMIMGFDLMQIIGYFVAVISGGGISGIIFYKYNKKNVIADSKNKENTAYQGFIDTIERQQNLLQTSNETYEKIFLQKDKMVNDMSELTKSYRIQLDENSRRIEFLIQEQEKMKKENNKSNLDNAELTRKIKGLQMTMKREISEKKNAQKYICTIEECKLRKPPLGTIGNEQE